MMLIPPREEATGEGPRAVCAQKTGEHGQGG